jgi:hypothetical protein
MLNLNRQSESSSPAAGENRELDAILNWLRGLSAAEMSELSEALATHNVEILTRFETRFQDCLNPSGR